MLAVKQRVLIEVAIESVDDARAAEAGGADRLELCTALDLGGLTPSIGAFQEIRASTRLPIVIMIRPRPGDFVYNESEIRVMLADIEQYLPHRPHGFVFGTLNDAGEVHKKQSSRLIQQAASIPCIFHRAFDRTPDPLDALAQLIDLGFQRVLSSGQASTAMAGVANLRELRQRTGGRIEVLPCGRVRCDNAQQIIEATSCDQLHGSFAEPVPEGPGLGYRGYSARSRTSEYEVRKTRLVVDELRLGRALSF